MAGETTRREFAPASRLAETVDRRPVRLLALGSGIVLVGAPLSVLYHVTDVAGGVAWLAAYVAGAFVLGALFSRFVPARAGLAIGLLVFLGGMGGYLALIPDVYYALFTAERVYADLAALATGQSVLLLLNADLWAVAIAPGPTFLVSYLALRRRYALAALAGGVTLGFFVLTGDAGRTVAMLGTAGALGLIGFGSIENNEGTVQQAVDLGIVLALALFLARTVDIVPGDGEGRTEGTGDAPPLESSLLGSPDQVPLRGSTSLSPAVRFTVTADRPAYWRVTGHDRYTGQGWVKTGRTRAYDGQLPQPPGNSIWLYQEVTVEDDLDAIPAAWRPGFVDPAIEDRTLVTDMGGLRPAEPFSEGDRFTVASLRAQWEPDDLRGAGTDYPDGIRERYLALPESTPDRLERRAREITSDAGTPYDAVRALVEWLEREKGYSLQNPGARWDVADTFVFEMESGYCVHFATALCVMLRSLGIPSRFAVGYTPGERAEDGGEWTVRGLHSHAWVEVFFPGTGWITVDPTPSAPREAAERRRIEQGGGTSRQAAAAGDSGVTRAEAGLDFRTGTDSRLTASTANASRGRNATTGTPSGNETSPGGPTPPTGTDGSGDTSAGTTAAGGAGGSNPSPLVEAWRRDRLSILVGAAGLTLGAYRIGLLTRLYRSFRVRRQAPTGSPEKDVSRALRRLEHVLGGRFRERRTDETPRGYLEAIEASEGEVDERVRRVVEIYERIHYAGEASDEEAAEAIRLVDELVGKR